MPDPNDQAALPLDNKDDAKPAPATADDVAALKSQLDTLQSELSAARAAQQDPAYIAYLAAKTDEARASREAAAAAEAKKPKLSDMTPEEFAEKIKEEAKRETMSEVDAIRQDLATKEALKQVEICSQKYPDFWEYQKEMMAMAKKNPLITAEEAYHAAKGTSAPRPVKPAKSEAPTGMGATRIVREPARGFTSKATAAWDKVFGKETIAS